MGATAWPSALPATLMPAVLHLAAELWSSLKLLARANARVLLHMARNWKTELAYLAATYAFASVIFHLPPLA